MCRFEHTLSQYFFTISSASSDLSTKPGLYRWITVSNSDFRRVASSIECDACDNRKDREDKWGSSSTQSLVEGGVLHLHVSVNEK